MKEEIKMDKLIELLNEYVRADFVKHEDWCFKEKYMWEDWRWDSDSEVISKEYWFIKRLVDNDKVDFDKVMKLWKPCFVWYDKWEIICVHDVEDYKQLLMLLSIQDDPTNILISVLK